MEYKNLRIHSTADSVDNFEFSILAFLESIVAMSISIWLAWTLQTSTHLLIAAFIAPFLLLRTKKSTEISLSYFEKFAEKSLKKENLRWWMIFSSIAISISIYFSIGLFYALIFVLLSSYIIYLFWIASPNQKLNTLTTKINQSKFRPIISFFHILTLGIITAIGMLLAILLGSIAIKITSTIITLFKNPLETIKEIPNNWARLFFSIDSFHPPELLPGIEKANTLHNKSMRVSTWYSEVIEIIKGDKGKELIFTGILFLLLTPLIFLPAFLYRWSLKSTSLIWYPLIYVIGKNIDDKEKRTQNLQYQLKKYSKTSWAKFQAIFASISIVFLTLVPLLIYEKLKAIIESSFLEQSNLSTLLNYIFAFQMNAWHWSRLIASVLTLILFFFTNSLLTKREDYQDAGLNYAVLFIRAVNIIRIPFSIFTILCAFYLLYFSTDFQVDFQNIRWLPI